MNKQRIYEIVFENNTREGRLFDIVLLWTILLSILITMLDSVPYFNSTYLKEFHVIEILFTIVFTVEYVIRIIVSPQPIKYIFSFWGLIDLFSILPTFISLFVYGYQYLMVVRILRLLRVFRILKLVRFNQEAQTLMKALRASLYKISIFFSTVVAIVIILGTVMYVVEGGENGYVSIPQSIYWAIITVTTVGYGDIVPHTVLGKFIASFAMIIGYAILAVPTGIVTVEISNASKENKECSSCKNQNVSKAKYCDQCGTKL